MAAEKVGKFYAGWKKAVERIVGWGLVLQGSICYPINKSPKKSRYGKNSIAAF